MRLCRLLWIWRLALQIHGMLNKQNKKAQIIRFLNSKGVGLYF